MTMEVSSIFYIVSIYSQIDDILHMTIISNKKLCFLILMLQKTKNIDTVKKNHEHFKSILATQSNYLLMYYKSKLENPGCVLSWTP